MLVLLLAQNIGQVALNLRCNIGIVHGIHMHNIYSVGIKVNYLLSCIGYTRLLHLFRVITVFINYFFCCFGSQEPCKWDRRYAVMASVICSE